MPKAVLLGCLFIRWLKLCCYTISILKNVAIRFVLLLSKPNKNGILKLCIVAFQSRGKRKKIQIIQLTDSCAISWGNYSSTQRDLSEKSNRGSFTNGVPLFVLPCSLTLGHLLPVQICSYQ